MTSYRMVGGPLDGKLSPPVGPLGADAVFEVQMAANRWCRYRFDHVSNAMKFDGYLSADEMPAPQR